MQKNIIGLVRRIDDLGRVVIPKEYRKILGMSVNEPVEIQATREEIIISKYKGVCLICGKSNHAFTEINEKCICDPCKNLISQK